MFAARQWLCFSASRGVLSFSLPLSCQLRISLEIAQGLESTAYLSELHGVVADRLYPGRLSVEKLTVVVHDVSLISPVSETIGGGSGATLEKAGNVRR